jgi:hypothetical protein
MLAKSLSFLQAPTRPGSCSARACRYPDQPRRFVDNPPRLVRHRSAGSARAPRGGRKSSGLIMADAIAVLNAGSSSFKFSLFVERGNEIALVARGQAEGLYTSPRFVAKDGAGTVIEEKSWGDGVELGHAGALDHLVAFLRLR